jgi:hypothetical protein
MASFTAQLAPHQFVRSGSLTLVQNSHGLSRLIRVGAMISELETVALTRDMPEHGLVSGDIGTVVHVYSSGNGVEVEFVRGDGITVAVLTLQNTDIRPLTADMLHARRLAS